MKKLIIYSLILVVFVSCKSQDQSAPTGVAEQITIENPKANGWQISVELEKGKAWNYPMMALWLADREGKYIQTLYVNTSVATSVYNFADSESGKWTKGYRRLPATLPFWSHQRNIVAADGLLMPDSNTVVPDAYSGATPKGSFRMQLMSEQKYQLPLQVFFEINQSWDWNQHWHNNKYPGNMNYKSSAQPAVVYSVFIDKKELNKLTELKMIGHSHPKGDNGQLYPDMESLTSAKEIVKSIKVNIR